MDSPWWREAVTYQIYPRSFADADGDGTGDLAGITSRLDHLADLGVDAIWLSPFYPSPQHDYGYDVVDARGVDPLFGTLSDAEDLLTKAHEVGLKVIIDLIPNHTSSEHPWFAEALSAGPGSPERDRYIFRDGRGEDGEEPPTNWQSVFGGSAWTRVEDGQWYLHMFAEEEPDLNWRHPEVAEEFRSVLRWWLDRGVDGFRVDVAHGLVKALRDQKVPEGRSPNSDPAVMYDTGIEDDPMWDHPDVHGVYRDWHDVISSYPGERMLIAEAWTQGPADLRGYLRTDEFEQAFNFQWLQAHWSAREFIEAITSTLDALSPSRAWPTWVLSNHDAVRHRTRYGDGEQALDRARAATLTMLGLPGSAYLYQGEELGLPHVEIPPEHQQDPWAEGGNGRDGCRVPLPWSGDAPPFGFGPGDGQPWLPQPTQWADLTVAAQTGRPGSTLEFYRSAIAARRRYARGGDVRFLDMPDDVIAFRRGRLTVVLNCGSVPTPLPPGDVVVCSGDQVATELPPDSAVWLLGDD
ncbi:glycoside hydrolase family 13 protein [Nocardioides sp. KC13]|uniref:Glycoside hydrolase family 13 protein n=1 Tax=Nocardioides turkmenicus TaxID=2711220 RepID=A0A6M1RD62_9ACTN|nr:glycoside hydrolase family 13 protein [Nocardioides sp. KC13]